MLAGASGASVSARDLHVRLFWLNLSINLLIRRPLRHSRRFAGRLVVASTGTTAEEVFVRLQLLQISFDLHHLSPSLLGTPSLIIFLLNSNLHPLDFFRPPLRR